MLIIGHRGAAGLAPENTLEALHAGKNAGADMLELDIRLTKDNIPIVIHDARLTRTHHLNVNVRGLTLEEIRKRTDAMAYIPTLTEVLKAFGGSTLLNIELKSRGSAKPVFDVIDEAAKKNTALWDSLLISSFRASELIALRRISRKINLALLHDNNPFGFIAYDRYLKLTAVGFHRLHTNRLALEVAKKAGLFTYVYTVNRPQAAVRFTEQGYDGIVTNYPDRLRD